MPKPATPFAIAACVFVCACANQESIPNRLVDGPSVGETGKLDSIIASNSIDQRSVIPPVSPGTKVFIANSYTGTLATYTSNGKRTSPTITGLFGGSNRLAVAVDGTNKIYIADPYENNVTSYTASGKQTTLKITPSANINTAGVAVDVTGNIYVLCSGVSGVFLVSFVTTYNALGIPILPTIQLPFNTGSSGLAVDASDNIYVVDDTPAVMIYNVAGTLLNTISAGLSLPSGVAVDAAGKIYVANSGNNTVTTYAANGTQTTPTITAGLSEPSAVAVDAAGNIYVTNDGYSTVTSYSANGTQLKTITGLAVPTGIAVHTAKK